jgi:tetratricopeptide (TPR) repeat protein
VSAAVAASFFSRYEVISMRIAAMILSLTGMLSAHAQTAEDLIRDSAQLQKQGKLTEAASRMRELLARPGLSPALTGIALNELGLALHNRNQYEEAERTYLRSIRSLESARDVPPVYLMRAHMNLASLYVETNRPAEAKQERDQVSVERMTDVADQCQALSLTASLALLSEDYDRAFNAYLDTLGFLRRHGGTENQTQFATTLNNLGTISYRRGKFEEAERWTRQAVDAQRLASGNAHPDLMKVLTNLAQVQIALRNDKAAGETLHEALNISRIALGDMHPVTAAILDRYAGILDRTGQKKLAKAARTEAANIRAEAPGPLPSGTTVDIRAFTKSAR